MKDVRTPFIKTINPNAIIIDIRRTLWTYKDTNRNEKVSILLKDDEGFNEIDSCNILELYFLDLEVFELI